MPVPRSYTEAAVNLLEYPTIHRASGRRSAYTHASPSRLGDLDASGRAWSPELRLNTGKERYGHFHGNP
jgi:hypothetical protein